MTGFWEDGNYGMDFLAARNKADAKKAEAARKTKWEIEEEQRNKLAAALWKMETHPGRDHCSSCFGEYYDGYAGGGVMMDGYCCCKDNGITGVVQPLDDYDYRVKYPPVNGKVPEIFEKWGPRTQERYLKRFEGELNGA
jgi:hypothetical protein